MTPTRRIRWWSRIKPEKGTLQTIALPMKPVSKIHVKLASWAPSAAPQVIGIDNWWIHVQRSAESRAKVRPLLNIGALVKYPQGPGGSDPVRAQRPREGDCARQRATPQGAGQRAAAQPRRGVRRLQDHRRGRQPRLPAGPARRGLQPVPGQGQGLVHRRAGGPVHLPHWRLQARRSGLPGARDAHPRSCRTPSPSTEPSCAPRWRRR